MRLVTLRLERLPDRRLEHSVPFFFLISPHPPRVRGPLVPQVSAARSYGVLFGVPSVPALGRIF